MVQLPELLGDHLFLPNRFSKQVQLQNRGVLQARYYFLSQVHLLGLELQVLLSGEVHLLGLGIIILPGLGRPTFRKTQSNLDFSKSPLLPPPPIFLDRTVFYI